MSSISSLYTRGVVIRFGVAGLRARFMNESLFVLVLYCKSLVALVLQK